jgi:ATP-binding protein involved in chromosome partitioning
VPTRPASQVIAIASGKGGVGKSTVALNLAVTLASGGAKVGLLDADFYAPDLPVMVGLTRREPAGHLNVWTNPALDGRRSDPVEAFRVKLMSTQFLIGEDQTIGLDATMARLLINRLALGINWGPLDWLLVDLPPGTADLQQVVAHELRPDGVVLVVTPQDVAHLDAKKTLAMFRAVDVPIIGGIENMAGLICPGCSELIEVFPAVAPERSIWADGVTKLASIPMQPAIARAGELGTPAVIVEPDGVVARVFADLAAVLEGYNPKARSTRSMPK